ncbi:AP-3 complex subunit delta-1 domain-containing protein [Ditylenchus destructor]|uniref:AP-3 complex subunit delta n=1 Tax=Ditylenchus destructor TaxID=166010 RepID=A0AAD4RD16_9BILA|nr:AP-3 complex subunit delta-1 domain-containing protein [Ditylenchus destructor]
MALRKVRSNIDRLFDKNLTDLIRGIRNNKENEARYIAACIEEIKLELRQDSTIVKANAIEKLAYLQMLGYDISWASFNIIEVMASTKYCEKRIGYLAATQSFNDETDVLMLTTNMIRKDLQSTNMYDVGVALSGLACFATTDLARDLVNDVVNLLSSSRTYVRKKAVLLLYKIFLKYPESLRPTFPRLRDKLEDPDPGVQSAAVNVICELARKNPRNYLSLHEVFFKLMNTSSNNWMLIKIIKLFGSLVPLEAKIGKKLLEPLTNLINSTSAMSLLYECINTVIAVLISISAEGPGDYSNSIQLCVQKLGVLIEDSDQNLKYLGLLAMGRILQTHPKAVQAHKDIVLRCLDDKDESIRLRALDLLYGMVSKRNIMEIVKKLMEHVDAAEGSFYRDELLSRIISICSHNNYQYITNFEWYISVLVELTKVEGSQHGILIAEQIQDVTVRVQSIRHFSVSQMALLVENAHLLLAGNSTQRNNVSAVLLAAAWICGEYAEHVNNIPSVLEAMLRTRISLVPGELLSVYIQSIAKLYSILLAKCEAEVDGDDWDGVESLDNLMLSKLPEFQLADHLEAQERACNLVELVLFVEKQHAQKTKVGEDVAKLFYGELNPVAAKAQKRVPVPEGLDLDAWINEPEPETEESESEISEEEPNPALFPTVARQQEISGTSSQPYSPELQQKTSDGGYQQSEDQQATRGSKRGDANLSLDFEDSKRRRQFEQENNPYYMKSNKRAAPSASSSFNHPRGAPNGKHSPSSYKLAGDMVETVSELQSPLEIPGVIGLDQYMKQQESTLSWRSAKVEQTSKRSKIKKKSRKSEMEIGSSKRSGRRAKQTTLSVLDDGEMPDDAISSQDEKEKHPVEDEFRALDINLDEPLRDDERLFAPKPYRQAQPQNQPHYGAGSPYRLPSNPRPQLGNVSSPLEKPRTIGKRTKKSKKRPKTPDAEPTTRSEVNEKLSKRKSVKSDVKKKTKKRLDKSVSNDAYTTIKSSAPKNKEGELISLDNNSQHIVTVDLDQPNSLALLSQMSTFEPLCENNQLKMQYSINVSDSDAHKMAVNIDFANKSSQTIRRIELNPLEDANIIVEKGSLDNKSTSAMVVPFELPAGSSNQYSVHLNMKVINLTQKMRGSATYFIEQNDGNKREEKIDFVFNFPALRFLQFSTIGSTSYEFMLSSGELTASATETCRSSKTLSELSDLICKSSNFSVVALIDGAVSLYAHDACNQPVCILIKKRRNGENSSNGTENGGESPNSQITVSAKCVDQALSNSIVQDICKQISEVETP